MGTKKKVIVVGGDISGLTVAHELSMRDELEVKVLERNAIFGGKARSLRYPDGNVGEHAMRGYMQPYSTLYGTLKGSRSRAGRSTTTSSTSTST